MRTEDHSKSEVLQANIQLILKSAVISSDVKHRMSS